MLIRVTAVAILLCRGLTFGDGFEQNFRNGGFDNQNLVPYGKGGTSLLQPMPEGLRVTLPGNEDVRTVGFAPKCTLVGDFRVRASLKVTNWRNPDEGAVGPVIYIACGEAGGAAVELSLAHRKDGKHGFRGFVAVPDETGERKKRFSYRESATSIATLELERTGDRLTLLAAEDQTGSNMEPLGEFDFVADDATLVRIGIKQNPPGVGCQVTFYHFHLYADKIPDLPANLEPGESLHRPTFHPPEKPPQWIVPAVSTTGFLTVLIAVGVYLRRRHRA